MFEPIEPHAVDGALPLISAMPLELRRTRARYQLVLLAMLGTVAFTLVILF